MSRPVFFSYRLLRQTYLGRNIRLAIGVTIEFSPIVNGFFFFVEIFETDDGSRYIYVYIYIY